MHTFKSLVNTIKSPLRVSYHGKDSPVTSISINSKTIQKGQWFLAIKGKNNDGHDFIPEAIKNQAAGLIVNKLQKKYSNIPQIITPNTFQTLGLLAKTWREQFNIPVIGITGSAGKTNTKEMLKSILQQRFNVLATDGNLNNEFGLPLSLMKLTPEHQIAILEMGINAPNEMRYLTDIAQPTIAVITNIHAAHIGNFNSTQDILNEKLKIFSSPKMEIAIFNKDNPHIQSLIKDITQGQTITYSCTEKADVTASNIQWGHSIAGILMQFKLHTPICDEIIALPMIGEHWISNSLAAASCALSVGAYPDDIKNGLKNLKPVHGRMYPYYMKNNCVLIDDTYNASADSVHKAIRTLQHLPGKRIFICSTLEELGKFNEQYHQEIVENLKTANFDKVYFTGNTKTINFMHSIWDGFEHIKNQNQLANILTEHLLDDQVQAIIVKGARKYKMENIITTALDNSKLMFAPA